MSTRIDRVIDGLRPMSGSNEMDAAVLLIEDMARTLREIRGLILSQGFPEDGYMVCTIDDVLKEAKCGECRFAVDYSHLMECHRRAPIRTPNSMFAAFPTVSPGDWCGDFESHNEQED